jgi:hypothetical protein
MGTQQGQDFRDQFEHTRKSSGAWHLKSRQLARVSAEGKRGEASADEEFWQICMSESTHKRPEYLIEARKAFEGFFLGPNEESVYLMGSNLQKTLNGNYARTVTGAAFAVTATGAMALVPPLSKSGICHVISQALSYHSY